MEKIEFDFSKLNTKEEKANALMQFLVNRAHGFDKKKYVQIYTEFANNAQGAVAYELCFIIGTFTGITVYTPRNVKKCKFYKKNSIIKPKFNFNLKKIKQHMQTMLWDTQSTCDNILSNNYPKVFSGFTTEMIKEIAEVLYGFER